MINVAFEDEFTAREQIVKWGKDLYDHGLVTGSGGNLSIRLDDDTVLLTPTGSFLGHLTTEMISKCDMDGNVLGSTHPTKEVPLHTAVYRVRPNVRAVCHTHSLYSVAYASSVAPGTIMPAIAPSFAAMVGQVEVKGYANPGSDSLGVFVAEGLRKSNAVLLTNHGVVAVGRSMAEAVAFANEVESNAIMLKLGGEAIRPIDPKNLEILLAKVQL